MLDLNKENIDFIWNLANSNNQSLLDKFNTLENKKQLYDYCSLCNIENHMQLFLEKNKNSLKDISDMKHFANAWKKKKIQTLLNIDKGLKLCNDLSKNNINYVALKGLSYTHFLSIEERTFRDIDILVEISDLEKCYKIAQKHGFNFKHKREFKNSFVTRKLEKYALPQMYNDSGVVLEIHYRIIADEKKVCELTNHLIKSKKTKNINGLTIHTPSSDYRFLHFAYHSISKGNFDVGISCIFDFFLLQKKHAIDFSKVIKIAAKHGLEKDVKIFKKILDQRANSSDKKEDKLYELIKFLFLKPPTNKRLTGFHLSKGIRSKLLYLKKYVFVENEILERDYLPKNNLLIVRIMFRWKRQLLTMQKVIYSFFNNFNDDKKRAKKIYFLKKHI